MSMNKMSEYKDETSSTILVRTKYNRRSAKIYANRQSDFTNFG